MLIGYSIEHHQKLKTTSVTWLSRTNTRTRRRSQALAAAVSSVVSIAGPPAAKRLRFLQLRHHVFDYKIH
jgi:hypothetical protein